MSATCIRRRKWRGVIYSDDSTSDSDNNNAILRHNKGMIAVKSDEDEDKEEEDRTEYTCIIPKWTIEEEDRQEEDNEEEGETEDTCIRLIQPTVRL